MVQNRLIYWLIPGIAGLLLFFLLRSEIDFLADATIQYSGDKAVELSTSILQPLNIETDTLGVIAFRQQKYGLYQSLRDSLKENVPLASQFNAQNFYLHGWEVITAGVLDLNDSFNLTAGSIYNASGIYRTEFDNRGHLKRFTMNRERGGNSFVEGDSLPEIARMVIEDIFSYDLQEYEFMGEDVTEGAADVYDPETEEFSLQQLTPTGNLNHFRWQKKQSDDGYERFIEVELQPVIFQEHSDEGYREIAGASVVHFEAYHELEQLPATSIAEDFVIFFFIGIALITLFVFIEGLGQMFKGRVDWKRVLFVSLVILIGTFGWRALYLLNFTDILTTQANFVVQINQLIYGFVMGLFAALAYIGWEAYARREKKFQINLIDAFWQGKFYFRETGESIVKGYSLGGILLGLTAIMVYGSGLYLFQMDSQFGFTEPMNKPRLLTINLSVIVSAALISVAMIGILYNFFHKRIKHSLIVMGVSILIGGILLSVVGRFFATNGTIFNEALMFVVLAVPLFYAYRESGVISVFAGLWMMASIIAILPYAGSPSFEVSHVAWIQGLFITVPFVFGLISYRNGPMVSEFEKYVPEYEEKMIRTLRIENELQIARQTQEKLMPLEAPDIQGVELFGYFIPSSEVGGDYFDYVITKNLKGEEELSIAIVDVSGKAMRAAMLAVFMCGLLRSRMYTDEPANILREISSVIYEKTDQKTFITCQLARYEPVMRKLRLSNAGHCNPILKRAGQARFLPSDEPRYPLGVREFVAYRQSEVELQPGDLLLFYSDGFPEATDADGDRFGFETMLRFIESVETDQKSARVIATEVKKRIEEFSNNNLADDTTLLCIKVQ